MRTDRIADLYAAAGPFASVHIDASRDTENADREVDLHARAVCEQLTDQGAPESVVETLRTTLTTNPHAPAPVSRSVVVTEAEGVLFDELVHEHTETPTAVWAPLPDVSAWLQNADGNTPFVLAVVDHQGGDVSTYVSGSPQPDEQTSVEGSDEHVHKVRGAGPSEMHYQNVTENVWARNAEGVADEIRSHVNAGIRLVMLAGDPQSRAILRDQLGESGPAEVLDVEHGGGRSEDGGDAALQEALRQRLAEHAVSRRLEMSHLLKDRLGRDDAVATGVKDVADAFVRGQVDTLLLDPAEAGEQLLSLSEHPGLALGAASVEEPVRADLALVAAATLTGAQVVVSPSRTIGGVPVAALLRWDQQAESTS